MQGFRRLSFDRLIWWGLLVVVLFAPLAVGTLHTSTRAVLFLLTGSLGLFLAGTFYQSGARVYLDGFVFWLLLTLGLLFLQVVPLGTELLEQVSPLAARLQQAAAELSGTEPGTWVSLDRAETLLSLAHGVSYLAFYVVAFNFCLRESNARRLAGAVASLGILAATVAVLHALSGSQKILWVYTPEMTAKLPAFMSFLVNPNHAAALFNLSALVFLGLGRDASAARPRLTYSILFLVAAAGTVATFSRGGVTALGVALLLYFIGGSLSPASGEETSGFSAGAFVAGSLLVLAAAGLFFVGVDRLGTVMKDHGVKVPTQEEAKLDLWKDALPMADDFQGAGTGRGAFPVAFTAYNTAHPELTFQALENEPFQVMTDFGITAGAPLLLLLLLVVLRRVIWGFGQPLGLGLSCGVVAVGVQNLTDFSLQIPGVAVPVLAVLAALSGGWRHKQRRKVLAHTRLGALRWLVVALPLLAVPLLVNAWHARHAGSTACAAVEVAAAAPSLTPEEEIPVEAFLEEALREHPANGRLAFLGAGFHQRHGSHSRAEVLLSRAERRSPRAPEPRLARALLAWQQGKIPEAAARLRDVLARHPDQALRVHNLFLLWDLKPADLVPALAADGPGTLIGYVDWLLARQQLGRAEAFLLEGLRVHGREPPLLGRLGFLYFGVRQLEAAERLATWLIALGPESSSGFLLQARIDAVRGHLEESLIMYEEARRRSGGHELVPLALEMMRGLVRGRQWDRFEAVASEIRLASQAHRTYQAEYYRIMASREVLRGKPYDALEALEKAEAAMPLSPDVAMEKGQIYASLGALDRAASEFRKALKVDPRHRAAQAALRSLESSEEAPPASP